MIAKTLLLLCSSLICTFTKAQVNRATLGWFTYNGFQRGIAGNIGL